MFACFVMFFKGSFEDLCKTKVHDLYSPHQSGSLSVRVSPLGLGLKSLLPPSTGYKWKGSNYLH